MHTARSQATATLLKNGKVLVAGGNKGRAGEWGNDYYATAELYDPATGRFTKTGSMHAARAIATATLLSNGKVLIAGGYGCSAPKNCTDGAPNAAVALASAELYDPDTGKFTRTGSMTVARAYAVATLLPDGRVLIGGYDSGADLYIPDSGKFVPAGREALMGDGSATLLPTGKVLMIGSGTANKLVSQLYDEHSRKFTYISLAPPAGAPTLSTPRVPGDSVAMLLKDGQVLLFDDGYLETYDPASGKCADAGFISPIGRWLIPSATVLSDGLVLFAGGEPRYPGGYIGGIVAVAVLYDPTGGPVRAGTTIGPRIYQTATSLPNGTVLIAGGAAADGTAISSAELYKP
jgi:hypothetical protein